MGLFHGEAVILVPPVEGSVNSVYRIGEKGLPRDLGAASLANVELFVDRLETMLDAAKIHEAGGTEQAKRMKEILASKQ